MLRRYLRALPRTMHATQEYIDKHQRKFSKTGVLSVDFGQVHILLKADTLSYYENIVKQYKRLYRPLCRWLAENHDRLPMVSRKDIGSVEGMAKSVALQLDRSATAAITATELHDQGDLVVHGNKHTELLLAYMKSSRDFWFIDSGYTNFIQGKKTWHRLVHNHVHHHLGQRMFPADRLGNLASFPSPWRQSGDRIVIVLASDRHYALHGTTQGQWRHKIKDEIRKYNDRPLEFRFKEDNRKIRSSLYQDLEHDQDVYCVISDSSAAAIEALWLGIPVITLQQHVTGPVARNSISQIEDLYRGPLGDWLCALTYSQFTEKEIHDGTAKSIIEKYHA